MKTPKFEIFQSDKDGMYYFRLKARNGRIIFNSKGEGYTQKHNAEECIEVLQDGSWRYRVFGYVDGYWYWTAYGMNDEPIGGNETYKTRTALENGIASVRRCAPIAEIVDLTKEI